MEMTQADENSSTSIDELIRNAKKPYRFTLVLLTALCGWLVWIGVSMQQTRITLEDKGAISGVAAVTTNFLSFLTIALGLLWGWSSIKKLLNTIDPKRGKVINHLVQFWWVKPDGSLGHLFMKPVIGCDDVDLYQQWAEFDQEIHKPDVAEKMGLTPQSQYRVQLTVAYRNRLGLIGFLDIDGEDLPKYPYGTPVMV